MSIYSNIKILAQQLVVVVANPHRFFKNEIIGTGLSYFVFAVLIFLIGVLFILVQLFLFNFFEFPHGFYWVVEGGILNLLIYHLSVIGLVSIYKLINNDWIEIEPVLLISFYLTTGIWCVSLVFDLLGVFLNIPIIPISFSGMLDGVLFPLRVSHLFSLTWIFISLRSVFIYRLKLPIFIATLFAGGLPIIGRVLIEQPNFIYRLIVSKFYNFSISNNYLEEAFIYLVLHVFVLIILISIFWVIKNTIYYEDVKGSTRINKHKTLQ